MDTHLDAKGRLKSSAVYIGGGYTLRPAVSVKNKRRILAASILSWFALTGALIPVTKASQTAYVIIPFAFSALPLFLATRAAVSLMLGGECMTRMKAERISGRLPLSSLVASMLSGAAFLGAAVIAILNWDELLAVDMLFGALSLLMTLAAAFVYSKSRTIKACKVDEIE